LLDRARSGAYLLCKAFGLNGEWIVTSLMHRPSLVLLQNMSSGVAFADVDEHMTIDPASVERLIRPGVSAILATHTYGKSADVAALRALADRHGVFLVENAVHMASGERVQDRPIGSWGDATLLSFNVDKPLGAVLGGALLTNRDDVWRAVTAVELGPPNDLEMRERIRTTYIAYRLKPLVLRLPAGRRHRNANDGVAEIEHFDIATYRRYAPRHIHPLQAKVALACLKREHELVARRCRNADHLRAALTDVPGLRLPESTAQQPHTYTYFPLGITQGSRYAVGERLAARGIETKWRLPPVHLQAGFEQARCDNLDCSMRVWREHLLLPAGCSTIDAQIDYLAQVLRES
jgi:dTDP-4-amino-4,6-dideoxygalactose transaminase